MRFFTGQFDRSIDSKNRLQLPSQLRELIDPEREGARLYVTLGENRGTLAIFTESGFEALAERTETEFQPGLESRQFELQFFALASSVDMDKQGRLVLPQRLASKAGLGEEVVLVGQKNRIEIWDRGHLEQSLGIDWDGDQWPDWQGFTRRRPTASP